MRFKQLRNYANQCNIHVRRVRHLRDSFNLLEEYDDEAFRLRFRLRKDSVSDLVKILEKGLEHQTRRGLPLTPMQQVLIALRFYATGTFQRVIGDLFGVSVFAACRVIHKVSIRGLLRIKNRNSCHSLGTWLISRESSMMLLSRCDRGHRLYPRQDNMSRQRKCYGICEQKAILLHQLPSCL